MAYMIPTLHRCDKCGYEVLHSVHAPAASTLYILAADPRHVEPTCPRCLSDFIRERCGIIRRVKQPEQQ